MAVVAYLANQFPSAVEPYVVEEIEELRGRGVYVVACSARQPTAEAIKSFPRLAAEVLCLFPLSWAIARRATCFCIAHRALLRPFLRRVLCEGNETILRRIRALVHTWLGVYYALRLEGRGVQHIHVHHGYFASWIAMVAAHVLGITYSMTLHGSDLLLHAAYLDTKLDRCRFCFTISEFNRKHLLTHYPAADPAKILVCRMGVEISRLTPQDEPALPQNILLLSVGRLHAVKDHAFLIQACRTLKDRGVPVLCLIAGSGPQHDSLVRLIRHLELEDDVGLLGHVPREQLECYYAMADLVVLTSRSEGVPLVLMEAMALGRPVLAPAITGVPELVIHGQTGFLYRGGSMPDFVAQVETICAIYSGLGPIRRAARAHVIEHFNREKNLRRLADTFLEQISGLEKTRHENPVLQQI